jgi:Glycosyl transferase family 90
LVSQERGVTLDAEHRGKGAANSLPLAQWARSRYVLHLRGRSYSASLKLQMLLGSPVVAVLSNCHEFYYPALEPQKHLVLLPVPLSVKTARPLLDAIMRGPQAPARAQRMARVGRNFAMSELGPEALDCYWASALIRYGKMYARLQGQ